MPMYDYACPMGHEFESLRSITTSGEAECPDCGHLSQKIWKATAEVHGDDIPGGIEIRHGLCNPDGSPRRFYSKSEMAKAAKEAGLVNLVDHRPDPRSGSDKSKHTSRWV